MKCNYGITTTNYINFLTIEKLNRDRNQSTCIICNIICNFIVHLKTYGWRYNVMYTYFLYFIQFDKKEKKNEIATL